MTSSADDNAALRAVVHGRVQGVGYRFFVIDVASKLGLTGYARNQSNGSVEVVAEGSQAGLDALLAELRRGPALARVDRVDASWAAFTGDYTGFGVR
jgi:acylphosphatase